MTGDRASADEIDEILAELGHSSWTRRTEALRRAATHLAGGDVDAQNEARVASALVAAATDPKWEVRKAAAPALAECRHCDDADRALDMLAGDPNRWVSHAAERAIRRRAARAERADDWELSPERPDPTLRHVAARIREIGLSSMTPARLYDIAMEISEQAYRELAADTAHEIRTLLTPLEGYLSELARRASSADPTSERMYAAARDRLRQIHLFVANLRDYSTPGSDAVSIVDLAEVIHDAIERGVEGAPLGIETIVEVPSGLMLEAMQERLARAIANLVANGCHAMERGGTLTVRARSDEPSWIEIVVRDTGCGMSPEMIEEARLRFHTTRRDQGGTGLGLPIAERIIVHDHRGDLGIESVVGQGTTVTLRLPTTWGGG